MGNGDDDLDDHDTHEQHDIFGNDVHAAPDGTLLTEKTDFFGNTVYESADGSNVVETTDTFGNTVYTDDGAVQITERDDVFGNNTLTDSEGHIVTELDGIGDTVTYRGDVEGFGHRDGADALVGGDDLPEAQGDRNGPAAEGHDGALTDDAVPGINRTATQNVANQRRRLQRAEVRRRPFNGGELVIKVAHFIKWAFIIGFVLSQLAMIPLFLYWLFVVSWR